MRKAVVFLKKEPVLCAAAVLAVVSCFFVPPDKAYIDYLNLPVLSLLFCLMAVVAGLRRAGLFDVLSVFLTSRVRSKRGMAAVLTAACFFSAALITNDVALITFVPFTIGLLSSHDAGYLIFVIVLETVAANLGSLLTPIGNPQNLFLYTYYHVPIGEFFRTTLPLGAACAVLLAVLLLAVKKENLTAREQAKKPQLSKKDVLIGAVLFVLCILTVLEVVPHVVSFAVVAAAYLMFDRSVFGKVDYLLLLTFVFFFVFVGNCARIGAVRSVVGSMLEGRVIAVSALVSQVISNVPAATLLASFTSDARGLIIGTNIGGLGTLIASMASLISYRQYTAMPGAHGGRYMLVFSVINFALLAFLLAAVMLIL